MKIKIIVICLMFFTLKSIAQDIPPLLSNFRIEADHRDRVYFDSSEPITGSNVSGYIISGNTITSLKINAGQTVDHYFSVSKSFTFWDNNTIRYEGGSNLSDADSNPLDNFTLKYIQNRIKEPVGNGQTYYVSVNGSDSNSGLEMSQAWRTISYAAAKVVEGDVVYIKAGDYGNEFVVVKNKGTSSNPIKFIGFKNTPGDKPTLDRSQTTNFSPDQMPYIHSSNLDGSGINMSGKNYIVLKNIQVEGYNDCIQIKSNASHNLLENIYTKGANRMGINGFSRAGISNTFRSVYIANTSAVGIRVSGERHLIEDFYVSSYGIQSMDYYISLYGGLVGTGMIVRNSSIVRDPRDSHKGHGISVKAEGYPLEHTLIENCKLHELGQAVELRHHQVKYTIVRNVTATGNRNSSSNLITFRDDTSNNIIENCTARGVYEGIKFTMNKGEDKGVQGGGHYNKVINTVFDNCKYNITINGLGATPYESTFNEFLNCTFYGSNFMFALPIQYGETNKFVNCIIDNVSNNVYGSGKLLAKFTYSNFHSSYAKPSGLGNISEDPNFENSANGDFRLKGNSVLIDRGVNLKDVKLDYDGNHRPQGSGLDIGAFEYQDNSTSSIRANAGEDEVICKGETVTLTANGGSQYTWSNGESSQSIEVSPSETTTYEVTVSDGNTSDKDQVTVTVNEVLANAGEDVRITEGEEITLTATGGDSYLWSNGETTASITVSPKATTTYTVTVTLNGCEAMDEVQVIMAHESVDSVIADAGKDAVICKGETVTLTASGGSQYTWSNGETSQSIEVSPSETTTYEVAVSEGNRTDTDQVIVNVNEVIAYAGEDVAINEGDEVTLTATGGDSYLWSNGATTASITVSPEATATYTVTVRFNGCDAQDEVQVIVNSQITDSFDEIAVDTGGESSEEELKSLEIIAYPNPTTGILKLESNNSHPELDIHLLNSNGQILYQDKTNSEKTRFSKELDLSIYTRGVYFVRFINSTQNEVKKVVLI